MLLSKIFKEAPNIEVRGLSIDSKKVEKNYIFFALDGTNDDGHRYIDEAIEKGATVVVYSREIDQKLSKIVYIQAENVVNVLNHTVKIFYGNPTKDMFVYAVTGTNGKTTTAKLIKDIGSHFEKSGYIGTLGFEYEDVNISTPLTTPDSITLNYYINEMKKVEVKSLALEVSSHGIAFGRVDSICKDLVILTNITHDYLEFHVDFENYLSTKQQLFKNHKGKVLLNIDDPYFKEFEKLNGEVLTYGKNQNADYCITNIEVTSNYSKFQLIYKHIPYSITTNLLGEYNVYNLTAAIAALNIRGYQIEEIIEKIVEINSISGRLTKIENNLKINAFVDYAHTTDGIEKVLEYAQKITPSTNRIIAVFGCAGRRDVLKRELFGQIANRFCNQVILTESDSRDENTREIALEIKKGITQIPCLIIEDRYEAIHMAVNNANTFDTIVVLGKGVEKFMYRSDGREHWIGDDVALQELLNKKENENEL